MAAGSDTVLVLQVRLPGTMEAAVLDSGTDLKTKFKNDVIGKSCSKIKAILKVYDTLGTPLILILC